MSACTPQGVERLTPREREVFEELVVGRASKLSIRPKMVDVLRARVMAKMQAQSLPHLTLAIEAKEKV